MVSITYVCACVTLFHCLHWNHIIHIRLRLENRALFLFSHWHYYSCCIRLVFIAPSTYLLFVFKSHGGEYIALFSYGPKYKDASTLLKLPHLPSENSPIYYHEPLIVPKREWVDRSIEGDSSVRVGSANWSNGCISCLTLLECLVKALWRGVCSQLRGHELKGYCTKFFMWRMSGFILEATV